MDKDKKEEKVKIETVFIKKDNITVGMNDDLQQGGSIASGSTSFGCSSENTATGFDLGLSKKKVADESALTTSDSTAMTPPMSYGWVCPKCGRVNAPWKSTCDCSKGIVVPNTPPNTPHTPYYNPPIETPNPFDPYGPYKWGDAPGWWNKGPMCEIEPKEGKFIFGIEYPDGHIEKCPPNYFVGLGNPIPCSPSAGDPDFGKPI